MPTPPGEASWAKKPTTKVLMPLAASCCTRSIGSGAGQVLAQSAPSVTSTTYWARPGVTLPVR
jgi:hypothetical protein